MIEHSYLLTRVLTYKTDTQQKADLVPTPRTNSSEYFPPSSVVSVVSLTYEKCSNFNTY